MGYILAPALDRREGVAGGGGEGGQKILELPSMEVTRAMDFLLVAERKFRRSGRTVLDGQGRGGRDRLDARATSTVIGRQRIPWRTCSKQLRRQGSLKSSS